LATVRNIHPRVGSAKALVAVLCRDGKPPEAIEAARAELAAAMRESAVQAVADSEADAIEREHLAAILLTAGRHGG
jgi:hypothetical protein